MSRRPHPAPMRRQRRSPVLLSAARPLPSPALTGPRPTVARSQGARHAAPPSLPRAAARPTRPTIPRAPRPRIRPTARAPALRLHRLRAAPGCPRPSMSPSSRSRIVVQVVAIGKFRAHRPHRARRPHRAHRAPTSASPPPSLSSRCGGPRALAGKNRAVCIPFSPNALKRPPSWQHPPEMHAFRDQDGNIPAPCIHFRAQSGDSGCMARESCRQGPFFASRSPKSRMARRCCQRRPAFLRKQPAVRPNGLCAMRQRHATRGMAERALRPAARAWPACRMRPPPAVLLVSAAACASPPSRPRSSPPSYTCRASPPETRHAVPVPMHLATCAPHPSRQPRGPTASRKQAEQHKQLNAGIKIGSPNGDPIEELFGFAQRLPDALQSLHQANELALSYLDHSTRQRLGGYVIGLSGNSFTVDLYAALIDHATSIAR